MSIGRLARKIRSRAKGQGMTEYIIIVALVAIAAIGVVTLFGDNIRALFGASADALHGETNVKAKTQKTSQKLLKTKGLKDFAKDNKP